MTIEEDELLELLDSIGQDVSLPLGCPTMPGSAGGSVDDVTGCLSVYVGLGEVESVVFGGYPSGCTPEEVAILARTLPQASATEVLRAFLGSRRVALDEFYLLRVLVEEVFALFLGAAGDITSAQNIVHRAWGRYH